MVCPTSAGAVVAVDVATRSLMWGYQYKQAQRSNPFAFNRGFAIRQDQMEDGWLDASVTLYDGAALVAPVDEDKFICLDLDMEKGKARWEVPRDDDLSDALYIGCIHQGRALVVCKHKLVTLDMNTGEPAWASPLELSQADSEMPSGRGFHSGDFYFLPTTKSSLLKISLADGQIVRRTPTPTPLGNLICYRDEVVSHAAGSVEAFYQISSLQSALQTAFKKMPTTLSARSPRRVISLRRKERRGTSSLATSTRIKSK